MASSPIDGSHKLLLDAARGILWTDDLQITSFTVAKARMSAGAEPRIDGDAWALPPMAGPPGKRGVKGGW